LTNHIDFDIVMDKFNCGDCPIKNNCYAYNEPYNGNYKEYCYKHWLDFMSQGDEFEE